MCPHAADPRMCLSRRDLPIAPPGHAIGRPRKITPRPPLHGHLAPRLLGNFARFVPSTEGTGFSYKEAVFPVPARSTPYSRNRNLAMLARPRGLRMRRSRRDLAIAPPGRRIGGPRKLASLKEIATNAPTRAPCAHAILEFCQICRGMKINICYCY